MTREGLKKPFLQKSKPVNTGAPARFLSKKMGFFRGYLGGCRQNHVVSRRASIRASANQTHASLTAKRRS
ncbi:hypothetical protein F4W70_04865 [Pseudomonas cannabina]|nr:hypothetical protein F4W70_04865 [Pseudomonas cannabina]